MYHNTFIKNISLKIYKYIYAAYVHIKFICKSKNFVFYISKFINNKDLFLDLSYN